MSRPGPKYCAHSLPVSRCGDVGQRADHSAEERGGVGEVVEDEDAARPRRCVDRSRVVRVGDRRRCDVQNLFEIGCDDRTRFCGDVDQAAHLFRRAVAAACHESLDLTHCLGKVDQCGIQITTATVQHAAQRGEAVLELHDLLVAVLEDGHESLQIADDFGDVPAAVGDDPADSGQLLECLSEFFAIAVHRVCCACR